MDEKTDFLAALVQSSNDAIYSKDEKALITSWNPAAERLYGYEAAEVIGRPISILVPDERRGEELDILGQILEGHRVQHYETRRVRKDGSPVEVSVSVSPVYDSKGRVVEAAVIARDISEQKHAERQIAEAQRREALALNDAVVQGLVASKLALEMNDLDRCSRSLAETLQGAKEIVARLLGESGEIVPGDLVRTDDVEGS